MVADDSQSVDRLPMLPKAEREQVVYGWNAPQEEYPGEQCVQELFEAQVERTPEGTAVVYQDRELSYAELNRRANRLAHYLRELGVRPDARVAICVERSLEMIVGVLAVLKAGGAYVPLDPAYPAERQRYMLADSSPVALLSQSDLLGSFSSLEVPILDLNQEEAPWQEQLTTLVQRCRANSVLPKRPAVRRCNIFCVNWFRVGYPGKSWFGEAKGARRATDASPNQLLPGTGSEFGGAKPITR
jgi:non-ribosomal peptide synthetase component F